MGAGPSPRGWGEPDDSGCIAMNPRTIPTRVGRTPNDLLPRLTFTDHPHAGGENCHMLVPCRPQLGPSPRGWGEPTICSQSAPGFRTIPTRVGRTLGAGSSWAGCEDHPHAGGENEDDSTILSRKPGPSPRGWGEHARPATRQQPHRTIPTRVGRTFTGCRLRHRGKDHPHAGGENPVVPDPLRRPQGPSPRGWGELETRR